MVKLFSKNSNLCDHNSPTLQTDRRTDRQTTCDRNTALCTTVHRAVKTNKCFSTEKHGKILSYSYVIFYCYDNYKTLFFYEKMAATYRVPSGIKMCLSFMSSTLSASKCDASKLFLVNNLSTKDDIRRCRQTELNDISNNMFSRRQTFSVAGPPVWNLLPDSLHDVTWAQRASNVCLRRTCF